MIRSIEMPKTLVQCDFDSTVTEEDVSFMILDAFANGDWRETLKQYQEGRISVGRFNSDVFTMVKADRERLLKFVREQVKVRPGFHKLVSVCRRQNSRFVIVSNGLDFYIEAILKDLGLSDIEVHAAKTHFHPGGLTVQYIGPDGTPLDTGFKEAYVNSFLGEGYRVIYVGDGSSDLSPARQCHHIFATGSLLTLCRQANLNCTPFTDFNEVVSVLESWQK